MADQSPKEPTRVAVVLVRSADKLLLVYNEKWRAFTFPMTKLPPWDFVETSKITDPDQRDISTEQLQGRWRDAAAHAVVECLGQPNDPRPLLDDMIAVEYSLFERSGRDGVDRFYRYKLFTLEVPQPFESRRQPAVWLTPDAIRDVRNRPVSPTVWTILNLQEFDVFAKTG
jgi:hypothetical protein